MAEFTWVWLAGAGLATVLGFAWLALAMESHWHQVHGGTEPTPATRLALRVLGSVSLVASAVMCAIADRPSMAALVWLMWLAAAAPLVALTLAWRPRLLRVLWPWGDRRHRGAQAG